MSSSSSKQRSVVFMPKDANIAVDDKYLVEMTDRLRRLRSIVGDKTQPLKRANEKTSAKKDAPAF